MKAKKYKKNIIKFRETIETMREVLEYIEGEFFYSTEFEVLIAESVFILEEEGKRIERIFQVALFDSGLVTYRIDNTLISEEEFLSNLPEYENKQVD